MARIRTIKPEFFHSLTLAECSTRARLLFVGLWTHCDDEGRAVDEPRIIKGALFPLDDDITSRDVDADLASLEGVGAIRRYVFEGKRYLVVCNWHHQKIDRPSKSRLPAPPEVFDEGSSNDQRALDGVQRSYLGPGPSTGDLGSRSDGSDDDSQHNSQERDVPESSSSLFEVTIQALAEARWMKADKARIKGEKAAWLAGTAKNIRSEHGASIADALEAGDTPQQIVARAIGDTVFAATACKNVLLGGAA